MLAPCRGQRSRLGEAASCRVVDLRSGEQLAVRIPAAHDEDATIRKLRGRETGGLRHGHWSGGDERAHLWVVQLRTRRVVRPIATDDKDTAVVEEDCGMTGTSMRHRSGRDEFAPPGVEQLRRRDGIPLGHHAPGHEDAAILEQRRRAFAPWIDLRPGEGRSGGRGVVDLGTVDIGRWWCRRFIVTMPTTDDE